MIKLIAVDIDGTLLNDQGQILPATIQAVQQAAAAGQKIVLCTGRPLCGVTDYLILSSSDFGSTRIST